MVSGGFRSFQVVPCFSNYPIWVVASQGSILGPLLFTVFINDPPLHVTSSEIDLYADDTTITSSADCGSMGKLQESLNTSVSEVYNWALANRLPLNEKKTKVLTVKGKRLSTKINNNPEITCNGSLLTNEKSYLSLSILRL